MSDVDAVLDERGTRYGSFAEQALLGQDLKDIIRAQIAKRCAQDGFTNRYGDDLLYAMETHSMVREALEMICTKMARIINGDPTYADNWLDIAGYAKLVADRLEGKSR